MYTERVQSDNEKLDNSIKKLEKQAQKNLNSRLDKMRFKNYTESEFNSTSPHPSTDISFVTKTNGDVLLYKGDTLLSSEGSGVDFTYALLTGYGTGLGGSVANEVAYGTNIRTAMFNERWIGSYTDTVDGQTESLDIQAWGGFNSSTKYGTVICQGTKLLVHSDLSTAADGFSVPRGPLRNSCLVNNTFNLIRNGVQETFGARLEVSKLEGVGGYGGRYNRAFSQYNIYYKIIVSRTVGGVTQERTLDDLYLGSPPNFNKPSDSNAYYPSCGFCLVCSGINNTEDSALHGQIINPAIAWCQNSNSTSASFIKETASNPYGLKYDIDTGAALSTPEVLFASTAERNLAYVMFLDQTEEIP